MSETTTKKLMNKPDAIVQEMVEGVAAVNPDIVRLHDGDWRVILARDLSTLTSTALSAELDITELPIRLLLAALTAFVCGPLVGIVAGCL